mgnify:CR=1 FL=1
MSLMQVSRRVDYALRAAIHLAQKEPGQASSVADISAGMYAFSGILAAEGPEEAKRFAEEATAVEEAAKMLRTKGTIKYDGTEHQNNMRSQRISLTLANGRFLLAEALMDRADHLFIMEADTPPNMPPPDWPRRSSIFSDDCRSSHFMTLAPPRPNFDRPSAYLRDENAAV